MPNAIDVRQTRELFGTFENNPVIVTTVDCLFVAHMLVVIWARRKDAQNQAKVRLYGPGEWEGEAGVNPCRSSREWGTKRLDANLGLDPCNCLRQASPQPLYL